MTPGDWLITALGAATALAGLALLAWSLLADRLRTRRARREGTLRRCPKCWYDMSATEGLTCPECGKTAKRERRLLRARRRYRHATASLLILALASATLAYPHGTNGRWKGWLPDTALLLLMRFGPEPEWASDELANRLWAGPYSLEVERPNRFTPWQEQILTAGCLRQLDRDESAGDMWLAWVLLAMYSQEPERAAVSTLAALESGDSDRVYSASMYLIKTAPAWPDGILKRAEEALEPKWRERVAAELERRTDEDSARRREIAESVALNPADICEALGECSEFQARILYGRLGLAGPGYLPGATGSSARRITWEANFLDDGETLDAVVRVDEEGGLSSDYLFFVRNESGWQLAGRVAHPAWAHDWELTQVLTKDGTRWISIRTGRLAPKSLTARLGEHWLRIENGRLRHLQSVTLRGDEDGYLHRRLIAGPPTIHRKDGSPVVTYTMGTVVELNLGLRENPTLGEDAREYSFLLSADPSSFNTPIDGGPWGTESHAWFLDVLEEELIPHLLPGLSELAISDDDVVQLELRSFMDMLADSDEVDQVRAALDAYIAEHGDNDNLTELRQRLDSGDPPPP
jgi:hypothetical protein